MKEQDYIRFTALYWTVIFYKTENVVWDKHLSVIQHERKTDLGKTLQDQAHKAGQDISWDPGMQ